MFTWITYPLLDESFPQLLNVLLIQCDCLFHYVPIALHLAELLEQNIWVISQFSSIFPNAHITGFPFKIVTHKQVNEAKPSLDYIKQVLKSSLLPCSDKIKYLLNKHTKIYGTCNLNFLSHIGHWAHNEF